MESPAERPYGPGVTAAALRRLAPHPWRRSRLGVWPLVAVFALLTAVPLALLAYFSVTLATDAVRNEVEAKLRATSAVSAVSVQREMESLGELVGSYAGRPSLVAALAGGDPARYDRSAIARQLNDLRAARPGVTVTSLTDEKGVLIDVIPATPSILGQDFSYRDWYRGVTARRGPYVSEAFRGKATGTPLVVAAAAPVWERGAAGGRMIGVVVAAYDLETIRGFAADVARAEDVTLTVTDQRGVIVASPEDLTELVSIKDDARVSAALNGFSGVSHHGSADGRIVSSYASVNGIGWTVLAEVPERVAFASVDRLRSTVVAIAVGLGVILLAGIALLASTLRKRRRAEAILAQNERRVRTILDAAKDAFISVDTSGLLRDWNRQSETVFGWKRDEAIGRPALETILPLERIDGARASMERMFHEGERAIPVSPVETTFLHRDGHVFPAEILMWLARSEAGTTINSFIRDITERKRLDDELAAAHQQALEASRLKSEFVANMSHEIRTPMNGVIGMTELLLDTPLRPEQRQYAETIRGSAESLLTVINDILDFSKIEAGRLELEAIDFDLRTAVEETIALVAERAHAKGLELAALIEPDVPTAVRGDPGRLRQILVNLVGNAIKFTQSGEVIVRVSMANASQPPLVRFDVTDTGIGIAAEDQERIFQSFAQVDASTTREYGGTGLGLAISKQLVELMGGEMGLVSQLSEGSTFWFTVRLEPAEKTARGETTDAVNLRGLRVLVVDDNATNRLILEQGLRGWGMRPDAAGGADEGLRALRAAARAGDPYALALLDLNMPQTNGLELARAIRQDASLTATHLVLLTSSGKRGDARAARNAGIQAFLSKPVRQSLLYDTIVGVMGARPGKDQPLVTRHTVAETRAKARRRVLVAEDNEVNQKVALRMLERLGYRVDVATNGLQAVEALGRDGYAAVLMDCQMPEMDGYEATIEIRRREGATRHTPIIAMTAGAMAGDAEKCFAAGMDDYLSKPVSLERLEATLERWLPPDKPNAVRAVRTGTAEKPAKRSARAGRPAGRSSRTPSVIDAEPALDKAALASLRELDDDWRAPESGFRDLLRIFADESRAEMEQLRTALAQGNTTALRSAAHSLKGSSGVVGARAVSELCGLIEQLAAAEDLEAAGAAVNRLEAELKRVHDALRVELSGLGGVEEDGKGRPISDSVPSH